MEKQFRREVEDNKLLAGAFLVSVSPRQSVELPMPPLLSRTQPTNCPYDDAWRAGVPPSGRWVLERGRPRWVPAGSSSSMNLSEGSVEAWLRGYKSNELEQARKSIEQRESSSSGESEGEASWFMPMGGENSTRRRGMMKRKTVVKVADPVSDKRKTVCLARSVRVNAINDDAPVKIKSKKKPRQFLSMLKLQGSLAKPEIMERIEGIHEILDPLDVAPDETSDSLARFEWAPLPTTARGDARRPSPFATVTCASSPKPFPLLEETAWISVEPPKKQPGKLQRAITSVGKRNSGHHPGRDQRSELKRLQRLMLSSAQLAFDADTWDGCGIEAEHLKKSQFAGLMLGGLFESSGKKDDAEEGVEATEEIDAPSPKDGKNILKTVSLV